MPEKAKTIDLRSKILNSDDIKEKKIEIEEWGCEILVRGLSGKDRTILLDKNMDSRGKIKLENAYPELIISTAYNPDSKEKIFEPADRDALSEKSGAALEKIARVAMDLSGLSAEARQIIAKN